MPTPPYETTHWEVLFGFLAAKKSVVYLNLACPAFVLETLAQDRNLGLPGFYWLSGFAQTWEEVWTFYTEAVSKRLMPEYRLTDFPYRKEEKVRILDSLSRLGAYGPLAVKVNDSATLNALAPFYDAAITVYPSSTPAHLSLTINIPQTGLSNESQGSTKEGR